MCNNDNYNRSTRLLAATTLRNVLGTKNLSEILSDRESIGDTMHQMLDRATDPWGVHVDRVEIKDVRLPQQMQRAMAAEAEATRDARAKVGCSRPENSSSSILLLPTINIITTTISNIKCLSPPPSVKKCLACPMLERSV